VDEILASLKWLGLDWDEGPFFQSERGDLYSAGIEQLLAEGNAYRCYCTKEELDEKRKALQKAGKKPMYDRACRHRHDGDPSRPHVVRFKMPLSGETKFRDGLRGYVTVNNAELDDFIIRRSDGSPTYNLVVVIDDADMGITDIVRGDDHLANTPKQVGIYRALGYEPPAFTHVSMILGSDRKRLSKRHGADSVLALKEKGFLQSAVVNMLARLGWSCGDQEVFTMDELVEKFSLDNITMSSAVFDYDKLEWLNVQHIKTLPDEKLAEQALPFVRKNHPQAGKDDLLKTLPLVRERSRTLVELAEGVDFYFIDEVVFDEKARAKFINEESLPALKESAELLESLEPFDTETINSAVRELADRLSLKLKKVAQPLRVALTGRTVSPPLFEMMSLLGKAETVRRIKNIL
jgi:glutamyl-tRNA synthetase